MRATPYRFVNDCFRRLIGGSNAGCRSSIVEYEPHQPMCLSLRKVASPQTNMDETFSVYPNPFENALNISFNQSVASEVRVTV